MMTKLTWHQVEYTASPCVVFQSGWLLAKTTFVIYYCPRRKLGSTNSAFSSMIKAVLCISGARGIFLVDYFLMFSLKRSPPRHALSICEHAYYISVFIKKPSLVVLNLSNSCCVIFRFHSLRVEQRDEITLEEEKFISQNSVVHLRAGTVLPLT